MPQMFFNDFCRPLVRCPFPNFVATGVEEDGGVTTDVGDTGVDHSTDPLESAIVPALFCTPNPFYPSGFEIIILLRQVSRGDSSGVYEGIQVILGSRCALSSPVLAVSHLLVCLSEMLERVPGLVDLQRVLMIL